MITQVRIGASVKHLISLYYERVTVFIFNSLDIVHRVTNIVLVLRNFRLSLLECTIKSLLKLLLI